METLEQRRKRKFKVVIKTEYNESYLKLTRNGHQWEEVALNHDEMKKVIKVLQAEVDKVTDCTPVPPGKEECSEDGELMDYIANGPPATYRNE